jgi:hypothetical protein
MKFTEMKGCTALLWMLAMTLGGLSAQTQKDDWMTGGTLRVNTARNSSQFEFSPSIGYFLIDELAIGARLSVQTEKLGSTKVNDFGFGPYARYFFGSNKVMPFFEGNFEFSNRNYQTGGLSTKDQAFSVFGGGGVSVFLNESVALEGILGYKNTRMKNQDGYGGLNLRVGFQIYLSRGQVESVRSNLSL